ncbi:solute carrier organic anion transporter family member 74D [Leptopilina heterotoma]|uniref:solute carrier organic anion transporter family member 74D n=1 Tax=Leptopilina heterotoma TaxID=63436 RepID=UPI001CA9F229|nr:solute carrier organic anion transporter family member 74D [Leptopilina heterotoma]
MNSKGSNNAICEKNGPASEKLLNDSTAGGKIIKTPSQELDEFFKDFPLTDETSCGIGFIRGPFLQRFANKKAYVFLYGVLGCIFGASFAYFNGTITTIEKRFKIPSKTTGIITVGNDISQLFVTVVLSYYAGKGHRPRWIAFGILSVVLFCCLTMLPHFLYGPGKDALMLTEEYGVARENLTDNIRLLMKEKKFLCQDKERDADCTEEDGNFTPQIILFIAQAISGVGGSLYYTLGVSYMDDNIQKSKTPALISFSFFIRMLGPAIGYGLASFSLGFYISPTLTPTITTQDPRWLGAWWLGWIILAILLSLFASIVALFPKSLPRAAARRALASQKNKSSSSLKDNEESELPSFTDMIETFKRLWKNKSYMCNNFASVFYCMGYMPYWIFMPKYIETQYNQSASVSSLITGTVGLVFSAFGILLSGLMITIYKPRARYLAAWNVMIGVISVMGMIFYAFLGCPANDTRVARQSNGSLKPTLACNEDCNCDYVTFNPVCTTAGNTFISACHAGCTSVKLDENGTKFYTNCSCAMSRNSEMMTNLLLSSTSILTEDPLQMKIKEEYSGFAVSGSCPVDCQEKFYIFLAVVCLLKFSGATGRASNFLVSVRCVEEKDKTVSMGFGLMIMSLFAFIPSPIFFGYILDKTCLVWGKTCNGSGNCWLYNGEQLRYLMNFTAAAFVAVGIICDVAVWYFVKNVKIFDEEVELKDVNEEQAEGTIKTTEQNSLRS